MALQQTTEYTNVSEDTNLKYVFDPDTYRKKDLTLTPANYKLKTEKLLAYGRLATKLRQQITD